MTGVGAVRSDLLALDADTLATLANRGLVKRAARELAAGDGPVVEVAADGAVSGAFPDGVAARLPAGAMLEAGQCSCAAPGVCRHLVGLVLAYQADHVPSAAGPEVQLPWSPGEFDDAAVLAAVGRSAVAAARRVWERGFRATVLRMGDGGGGQSAPAVELAGSTVRFPVPHSLNFALSGATSDRHGEQVALAVWAFRAADADGTPSGVPRTVGGGPAREAAEPAVAATALVAELLRAGTAAAGPVLVAQLARAEAESAARSAHWPAAALGELRDRLAAYADRAAHYDPDRVAELLAELCARDRAADRATATGVGESAVTPLRRSRLVSLGCRITGRGEQERTAAIYLAQPDAGIVLVLRKHWRLTDGGAGTGADLAGRRVLGQPVRALAAANLVSESITRSAGRAVAIGRGRVGTTTVTDVGGAWTSLPAPLLLDDAAAHLRSLRGRPPRLIRPRIEAEDAHVLAVAEVGPVGYDPARQRLEVVLYDPAGNAVLLSAEHDVHCPGRLDALADALARGPVTHVSGLLRQVAGRPVLDPLTVRHAGGLTSLDLAPAGPPRPFDLLAPAPADPLAAALVEARTALADLARIGLDTASPAQLAPAATTLRRAGLRTAAALLDALAADPAPARWADAAIHVLTALDLHEEAPEGP
ncbi:hypothetical protein ACIQF6_20175 [Kitasatospora sp. NPDC092948]|uniref:hypothetical protein n=1 Tax=Kitasatospora sp. NPDC092948 TaxID=3364088 RepID=UPI003809C87E